MEGERGRGERFLFEGSNESVLLYFFLPGWDILRDLKSNPWEFYILHREFVLTIA